MLNSKGLTHSAFVCLLLVSLGARADLPLSMPKPPPLDPNAPMVVSGSTTSKDRLGKAQEEEETLVIQGNACGFVDVTFATEGSYQQVFPCAIKSMTPNPVDSQGGAAGNARGSMIFTLTLPEGPHDYSCNFMGGSYTCNRAFNDPVSLAFAGQFHGSRHALPDNVVIDATDQRVGFDINQASSGTTHFKPIVVDGPLKARFHLRLSGMECRLTVDGMPGASVCALQIYSPQYKSVSVLLSGGFFKQSDLMASTDLQQVGDVWTITPMRPDFFTPKSTVAIAVLKDDVEGLKTLIATHADVNTHDPKLDSPLATAVMQRHADLAMLLLDAGADPNVAISYTKQTVLAQALQNGVMDYGPATAGPTWLDVAVDMITHGAKVDAYNGYGATALMGAAVTGDLKGVKLLLDAHADPSLRTKTDPNDPQTSALIPPGLTAAQLVQAMQQKMATLGMQDTPMLGGKADDLKQILVLLGSKGPTSLPGTGVPAGDLIHFVNEGQGLALVGAPGAAERGETVVVKDERTGVTAEGSTNSDGGFRVRIQGLATDYYSVTLKTESVTGTPVYLNGDDPALDISVDHFVNYRLGDDVVIAGHWQGPENVEILLSDGKEPEPVTHDQGHFMMKLAALPDGNKFTLNLTTLGGLSITRTVKIGNAPTAAPTTPAVRPADKPGIYAFDKSSLWGLPNHTVNFVLTRHGIADIKSIRLSARSDGKTDLVVTDPAVIKGAVASGPYQTTPPTGSKLSYTYAAPGLYATLVTVETVDGATYQDTVIVLIRDPAKLDAMFTRIWRNAAGALAIHDLDAVRGMQWQDGHQSPESEMTFLSGRPDLTNPNVPLKRERIEDGSEEYASIERKADYSVPNKDPKTNWPVYPISFIEYPGGLWHLDMLH